MPALACGPQREDPSLAHPSRAPPPVPDAMLGLLCALLGACAVATLTPPAPAPSIPAPVVMPEAAAEVVGETPPGEIPPGEMARAQAGADAGRAEPPQVALAAPLGLPLRLAPPAAPSPAPAAPGDLAVRPAQDLSPPEGQANRPAWQAYAVAAPPADGRPTISLLIDDMGVNVAQSARAMALPGPLTLSWLPYATRLSQQVAAGAARGHETMLHMPMEPLGRLDPGPGALRTWQSPERNLGYLRAALAAVPGAVGLNQHEGSVASLSTPLMDLVMGELRERGMAFVDSRTIPHSVALRRAQAAGLPSMAHDLFLDNDPNPAAIRARLAELEGIARRSGHAMAIAHPRQTTMDVLEQYLPTLAARGFTLWPVSAAIAAQAQMQLSAAPRRD